MSDISQYSDGFYWISSPREVGKSLVKLYTYQDEDLSVSPIRLVGFGIWDGGGAVPENDLTDDSVLEPVDVISSKIIQNLKEVKDAQGSHGTWNCNSYMQGLYNGLELALAIIENRDPLYKGKPDKWLDEIELDGQLLTPVCSKEER
jgi:hypothetical protein